MRRFTAWLILAQLTTVLATGLASAPARADEPQFYDVELIVFKNIDPSVMDAERWPTEPKLPAPSRFLALNSLISGATASMGPPYQSYTALPASDLQLGGAVKKLEDSRRYRVLLHTGWREPAADEKAALPVWIDLTIPSGDPDSPPPPISSNSGATAPAAAVPTTAPNLSAGTTAPGPGAPVNQPPQLEGTVQFYVSRYMHFEVHLAYLTSRATPPPAADGAPSGSEPATAQPAPMTLPSDTSVPSTTAPNASAAPARTPVVFQLDEERRVRSGELHYFDHPGFGVLVQVTPYTPPKSTHR
ncbi:MAG TPA: CsiV family protein [Gammaproteobacteria bacterium]|nr:CsiV family protein [Gammaproteobacteria bacterium]